MAEPAFTVDASQLDEIFPKIEKLVKELHGKGKNTNPIRNASRKMADVVEKEAVRLVPVDEGRTQARIRKKIIGAAYRDNANRYGNSREYYYVGVDIRGSRADPRTPWWATPLEVGWDQGDASFEGANFLYNATRNKESEAKRVFIADLERQVVLLTARIAKEKKSGT